MLGFSRTGLGHLRGAKCKMQKRNQLTIGESMT